MEEDGYAVVRNGQSAGFALLKVVALADVERWLEERAARKQEQTNDNPTPTP